MINFSVKTFIGLLPCFSNDSISNKLLIKLIKYSCDTFFTFLRIKKILFGLEMPARLQIFSALSFPELTANFTMVWILIWLIKPAFSLKGGSPFSKE